MAVLKGEGGVTQRGRRVGMPSGATWQVWVRGVSSTPEHAPLISVITECTWSAKSGITERASWDR